MSIRRKRTVRHQLSAASTASEASPSLITRRAQLSAAVPVASDAREAFVRAGVEFLIGKEPPKHVKTSAARGARAAREAAKRAGLGAKRPARPDPSDLGLRLVADWNARSHAAPLFHFPDRLSLLAAVAAEGFRMVTSEMRHALEEGPERSGASRLVAVALAYVRWAGRQPSFFWIMYDPGFAKPLELLMRAGGVADMATLQAYFEGDERATQRRAQAFVELLHAKNDTLAVLQEAVHVGMVDRSVRGDPRDVSIAQSVAALMDGLAWQRVTESQGSEALLDCFAEGALQLMVKGIGVR